MLALSAMAMSFLILIVLVSSKMMIPLDCVNFTNAAVIQEFERECTGIEQERRFFESTAPLAGCIRPWSHDIRCGPHQCSCRGGEYSFGQVAELGQRLLSSDQGAVVKPHMHITDSQAVVGVRNFSTLFGLNLTETMRAVFGNGSVNSSTGEQSGNILFGGRGIITRTLLSLRSVLNSSADLIRRLFFALRLSYEHNRALNETIRNMQAHHEAYVRRTETEKEIEERALNYY